jgi:hypothetical protein
MRLILYDELFRLDALLVNKLYKALIHLNQQLVLHCVVFQLAQPQQNHHSPKSPHLSTMNFACPASIRKN